MTGRRPFSELTKHFTPERQARTAAKVRALKAEMPLAELRQARERSQKQLARTLKVGQPAVAKLEKRADMYVSNLRRYIAALGGSLEITARFPEGAVSITNFSDLDNSIEEHRSSAPRTVRDRTAVK
jgi:transcriptional regulator with XRE-family HTH domain